MNQPQEHMCSPSRTPLPPPSPSHLSGLSQCTSFGCPALCIKLALVIYFAYGNMHVSMLFLQISHPRLLPHRPKVRSLHPCLFACLAYRIIITIFLNFVYTRIYMCVYVHVLILFKPTLVPCLSLNENTAVLFSIALFYKSNNFCCC